MVCYYDDNIQTWVETLFEEEYDSGDKESRAEVEDALKHHNTQFFVDQLRDILSYHLEEGYDAVLLPILLRTIDYEKVIKRLCEYIYENYDIAVVEWVKD
jgi:hypothetical protein